MKSPLQEFSDERDDLIKNGSSIGVFDLPADYIENLEVEVICSTYIEYDGMHFILKVSVVSESAELFCRITSGDGGVLIQKSNFTKNMKDLLIPSEEGWTYF